MRVGIGQDSHRFDKTKPLVICGKIIPDHDGFEANSDGDVVYHALCNAIGTAIGEGSLSKYSEDMCHKQGIKDSSKYVLHINNIMKNKGFSINNIAISIECKTPKIEPHVNDFKQNLSLLLNIKQSQIGIAATSGENLTAFGKGEGVNCFVIVSLK